MARGSASHSVHHLNSGISDAIIYSDVPAGTVYSGLTFRVSDSSNYWILSLLTTALQIVEVTGGVTVRASTAGTFSGTYTMQLTLNGTSISGLVGSTSVNYTSSVRQTVTNHGLWIQALTNQDNFKITTLT
jgi:hypothetical protein